MFILINWMVYLINTTVHIIAQLDVQSSTYIDSSQENNLKNPKFKIGDIVRKSKYKNIFAKGYTPNWSQDVFVIKKVKNTVPWTSVVNDFNGEEIVLTFYKK